eukprot:14337236-Alexandrium_andersonii.AAC.1
MGSPQSTRGLRRSSKCRGLRMSTWGNSLARMPPGLRRNKHAWLRTQRTRSPRSVTVPAPSPATN